MKQFEPGLKNHSTSPSSEELKKLSNDDLIANTKTLANEERQLTARLLECLSEIRTRGLHLERGYPSLFQFCVDALGFTESQAHSRISAMKLSQELPEVVNKVASGEISLTNAAAAQVFFRNEKKAGKTYSINAKRELVSQLEGLSTRQCERKLAEISPQSTSLERERPIGAHQTELKIIADEELMRDLQKLKELWSHSLKDGTYAELLKKMALLSLQHEQNKRVPKKEAQQTHINPTNSTQTNHSPKTGAPQFEQAQIAPDDTPPIGLRFTRSRSRHIPRPIWRAVWQRDQSQCAYADPQTGKRCDSKHRIQIDHIRPFALGGQHEIKNLRLACQAHNLWRTNTSSRQVG